MVLTEIDTETRLYKGFDLTAIQHAGGWQVHIYGIRKGVVIPDPGYAVALDKGAAFLKAELLIEGTRK
jgi:hypothetical protein